MAYSPTPPTPSYSTVPAITAVLYTVPCFKSGTKILTDMGYLPIEKLKIGTLIKTRCDGLVPIALIGKRDLHHPADSKRIKDQLYVCPRDAYPELWQDLIITGCHSILIEEFEEGEREETAKMMGDIYLTDDRYRLPACIDKRTRIYDKKGTYTIYHIALENKDYYMNYGIYANGLLVESCSQRYLRELSNMKLIGI
jgi:hypothetical protein